MKTKLPRLAIALAALIALPLAAGETKGNAAEKPAAPAAEAAMKVFIDPSTGKIDPKADPPTRGVLPTAPASELPALRVEKGTTKAGGKRVRLDNRFMMAMTASAGTDGKVSQSCEQMPEAAATAVAPAGELHHER